MVIDCGWYAFREGTYFYGNCGICWGHTTRIKSAIYSLNSLHMSCVHGWKKTLTCWTVLWPINYLFSWLTFVSLYSTPTQFLTNAKFGLSWDMMFCAYASCWNCRKREDLESLLFEIFLSIHRINDLYNKLFSHLRKYFHFSLFFEIRNIIFVDLFFLELETQN